MSSTSHQGTEDLFTNNVSKQQPCVSFRKILRYAPEKQMQSLPSDQGLKSGSLNPFPLHKNEMYCKKTPKLSPQTSASNPSSCYLSHLPVVIYSATNSDSTTAMEGLSGECLFSWAIWIGTAIWLKSMVGCLGFDSNFSFTALEENKNIKLTFSI